MSIWASSTVCGEDDNGNPDGTVLSYIDGWSNHYPTVFPAPCELAETPALVGTAWIPPWCVPGHDHAAEQGIDIDTHVGPWLRLDLSMRTVSIWSGGINDPEIGKPDVHSVCLNETAVRALRDNLTAWLDRTKCHPREAQ